ncbi:MAG: GldG family protein [Gammaproteobacteria bacterium]|nr:GldG family protein [Gammaproteobacteria bacterium]
MNAGKDSVISLHQRRLHSRSLLLLVVVMTLLLALLSHLYPFHLDLTATGRHTLSPATLETLKLLQQPVTIDAYIRDNHGHPLRQRITALIGRYQQQTPDLSLHFVDIDREPQRVRAESITREGELVIRYGQRKENLSTIGEQALTNALQRLLRTTERQVIFISGHGERSPRREANHDLSLWAEGLKEKGLRIEEIQPATTPAFPAETAAVVLASPRIALLGGEVALLQHHIGQGGNLLWLHDPDDPIPLLPLQQLLGIRFHPGTLVDPATQQVGIDHPAMILVNHYPNHPLSRDFGAITLFPFAHPLSYDPQPSWQVTPLLQSQPQSWAERGPLQGTIQLDDGEERGPLPFALILERQLEREEGRALQQRVVVVADGDFLSNAYLGNGANRELGDRILHWLARDDHFIAIPPRTAGDTTLRLTPRSATLLGFGFLILLPGGLLTAGLILWFRRRRR